MPLKQRIEMALSKKDIVYRTAESEQRDAYYKMTAHAIRERGLSSFMNDHKWYAVFEEVESLRLTFEIKTILDREPQPSYGIYELEKVAILTNATRGFVGFWEIERLYIAEHPAMEAFLKTIHVEYYDESGKLVVVGYR